MLVTLETKNRLFIRTYAIPFVGETIFLIVSLMPAWLVSFAIQRLFMLSDGVHLSVYLALAAVTHAGLWIYGTKVRILYLPMWTLLVLGFVIQTYISFSGAKIRL